MKKTEPSNTDEFLKKISSNHRKLVNEMEEKFPGFKAKAKEIKKSGITLPYLTYPDITKPIWTEFVCDNDELYRLCKSGIRVAQFILEGILDCENVRDNPNLKKIIKRVQRNVTTSVILTLWESERYLVKFEQDKYLPINVIEKHRKKIEEIREKLLQNTIKENLRGRNCQMK
jgi:hypothetical protein